MQYEAELARRLGCECAACMCPGKGLCAQCLMLCFLMLRSPELSGGEAAGNVSMRVANACSCHVLGV